MACTAQPVSLAHLHNSTWLYVSIRQATSQVQQLALYRPPTALAHQLLEILAVHLALQQFWPLLLDKHVFVCTDNTHCGCLIHQPTGRSTIMLHVTTHLPSPLLESDAAQVAARRPRSGGTQSCGQPPEMYKRHRQNSPSAFSGSTVTLWSYDNTFCMQRKLK